MDPISLALIGGGILLGGLVVGTWEENDKASLRETALEMERSHLELERRLRQQADREAKLRLERLLLTLGWCQERMRTLSEQPGASLMTLQRVWSAGKAIEKIVRGISPNAKLNAADTRFVDLMVKAKEGTAFTRVERVELDEYLANNVPDAMREFMEDRLASMLRRKQGDLERLLREESEKRRELRALEDRQRYEGADPLRAVALTSVRARLAALPAQLAQARSALEDLKTNLVVVVRLSRPDAADENDEFARELLERLVRGQDLTEADREFLAAYRDTYFFSARECLRRERKVDLAGVGAEA